MDPSVYKRRSARLQRESDEPGLSRVIDGSVDMPGTDYTVTRETAESGRVFHIFEYTLRVEDIRFPSYKSETLAGNGKKRREKSHFSLEGPRFACDRAGKFLPPPERSAHPLEDAWVKQVHKPWYEERVLAKDERLLALHDMSEAHVDTIVCKASDFASDYLRVRFVNGPVTENMAVVAVNQILSLPMTDDYYGDTTWSKDYYTSKPAARGVLLGDFRWVESIDTVDNYGFFNDLETFNRSGDPHFFIILNS
jgi:hypothetical protein